MVKGRSVRLYLVEGTPKGLVTAEIVNWSGHVLSGPRTKLAEILNREESARSGVYLLLGESQEEKEPLPIVYVGESEEVRRRLKEHNAKKDFWDHVWVITSQNLNLTKSHIKYLEGQLVEKVRASMSCKLDNKDATSNLPLPEADRADMEFFLSQVALILPIMGFEHLRSPVVSNFASGPKSAPEASPVFERVLEKEGLAAYAVEEDGRFIVQKGSKARGEWKGAGHGYATLYERMVAGGLLVPDANGLLEFVEDTPFDSPSAAAAVVAGRSANGRREWTFTDSSGASVNYGEWKEKMVEAAGS